MTDTRPLLEHQLHRYGVVLREDAAPDARAAGFPPPAAPRRHPGLLVAAALFVVAAIGLAALALHPGGTDGRVRTTPDTTTSTGHGGLGPEEDWPAEAAADERAKVLVGAVPTAPGWTPTDPPALDLNPSGFGHMPATPDLAHRTFPDSGGEAEFGAWVSNDSWADVDTWIRDHPPAGMYPDPGPVLVAFAAILAQQGVHLFAFLPAGAPPGTALEGIVITTTPEPDGHGVLIQAKAEVGFHAPVPVMSVVPQH